MVKTFAAIDVGSYELSMKIYEVSRKNGMRQIDHVRRNIDMGTETYSKGILSYDRVDELCTVLKEFKKIMNSYKVSDYKAYGTSAIREVKNTEILIDLVMQRTGIKIEAISNSEQRFLDYKSVAFQGEIFDTYISKPTAILDIGGGSIQLSLFENDTLYATQNMKLGVLRLLDRLNTIGASYMQGNKLVRELCDAQLNTYKKLYLKDNSVENLILIDDSISRILNNKNNPLGGKNMVSLEELASMFKGFSELSRNELARRLSVSEADVMKLYASLILVKSVLDTTGAKNLWAPGVTLCDGMAYEYAENTEKITTNHDFEKDIRACALQISKRYSGSKKRAETLEKIALTLFDATEAINGLSKRDRLLLQISSYLHDCGKYISMSNLSECSYEIIKNTEIIGLSHRERVIVANVVRYNQEEFDYYLDFNDHEHIEAVDHMRIAKLTALLRLANGLDRSHKMKFKDVLVSIEGDELLIQVDTNVDITLEKGLFGNRAAFFEEVYNLKPVIKQRKSI